MEYMPNFALYRPKAVEEAVKLRAATPGARYVAGGTDMIVNVRRGIEQPPALIDLGAIEAIKAIRDEADALLEASKARVAPLEELLARRLVRRDRGTPVGLAGPPGRAAVQRQVGFPIAAPAAPTIFSRV